jgi:CRISPR-associated endonuclease/helicase Cas3
LFGLPADAAKQLVVALTAMHDLGKFAPAFQQKSIDHWPQDVLGDCDPARIQRGSHTDDGIILWQDLRKVAVPRLWKGADEALSVFAPAVFGHHGRPVGGPNPPTVGQRFPDAARSAAFACADAMFSVLIPEPLNIRPMTGNAARRASWWLAGFITICDWVGSNPDWFPYMPVLADDTGLSAYWAYAQDRASEAASASGLVTPRPAERRSFQLITGLQGGASPAQRWADNVEIPAGPTLFFVEDVTGSGKTEAAQILVHRLMASHRVSGVYWAMPTQATANAMYGRQAKTVNALFDDTERRPSLVLAHSQQRLNDRFRSTVISGGLPAVMPLGLEGDADDVTGAVACVAWLANDRRRAMLADVGSGTIDQALLGVLPSKFNAVRLFGLAGKALVIDEAHAYDSYMSVELAGLLRFHALLGGCAIVLSATLPKERREAIATAWIEGLNGGARRYGTALEVQSAAYPLATIVSAEGVTEQPLEAASWSRRSLSVRLINDLADAAAYVATAAAAGAAVAWIRNTVDDCLAAAALLRDAHGVDAVVFHARFAQADRQVRENEVLSIFGDRAGADVRRGRVLVATQVVEQSLDLDFDAMVSDVAPVDLLVQRAGRLRRHPKRDESRPLAIGAELVVLSPTPNSDPPSDWLGGLFRGTARIYRNAGVLWRTVQVLDEIGSFDTPGGIRYLIEKVYAPDNLETPRALQDAEDKARTRENVNAAAATYGALNATEGYNARSHAWASELRVPTRLGDAQTLVRLARVRPDGTIEPWAKAENPLNAWSLSEIRVSAWQVPPGTVSDQRYGQMVGLIKDGWGPFEQEIVLIPLHVDSEGKGSGNIFPPNRTDGLRIRYDCANGLMYSSSSTSIDQAEVEQP